LDGALALSDTAALVMGGSSGDKADACEKGRVGRSDFLLDLEEEGVARTVAFEVDNVIAEADAAGADDLEANVDGAEEVEEMAAVGGLVTTAVDGLRSLPPTLFTADGWSIRRRSIPKFTHTCCVFCATNTASRSTTPATPFTSGSCGRSAESMRRWLQEAPAASLIPGCKASLTAV
jgi:hypothetical protein